MNSDNRSIGIFDSGIGGMTVAKALTRTLPNEQLIYFGDTAHLPYGAKSRETIIRLSLNIGMFLQSQHVKILVIACNSATTAALPTLQHTLEIPVIGVVDPGAQAAMNHTRNKKIGVIGTRSTINSQSYKKALLSLDPDLEIFQKACPLFVPLVEETWIEHPITKYVIEEYLHEFEIQPKIDTLLLGCTHYPLLKTQIASYLPDVHLVDSAETTALAVKAFFDENGLHTASTSPPRHVYYLNDVTDLFLKLAERIMDYPLGDHLEYTTVNV
jgi:glutamate racemase